MSSYCVIILFVSKNKISFLLFFFLFFLFFSFLID